MTQRQFWSPFGQVFFKVFVACKSISSPGVTVNLIPDLGYISALTSIFPFRWREVKGVQGKTLIIIK